MADRIGDGLVRHDNMLWSRCVLRTPRKCVITGEKMAKGSVAYRPITNGYDRMNRVSAKVWDDAP